jgi:hypothetical protein
MNHAHYMNFILNALLGTNPDAYYREHQADIEAAAAVVRRAMGATNAEVWRGVLLDPREVPDLKLKPLDHITFLSFSSDREVAKGFANIDHPISQFVKWKTPHYKGYLIKHVAESNEILFHHDWADRLHIGKYIEIEVVKSQKEVILNQTFRTFDLEAL